jgi:YHS domain-containing protein
MVLGLSRALLALAVLVGMGVAPAAFASDYNKLSLNEEAIEGFDVMAYWQGETPTPGSRAYSFEWRGAVWLFASAAHLAKFRSAPERYAPAFGGYCAYAMSKGIKADIHPFIYKIAGDRLFLFYSFESREKFLADPSLLQAADGEWATLSEQVF